MRAGIPLLLVVAPGLGLMPSHLHAGENVNYLREIKPLLAEKCFACHGALRQKADLRLDTVAAMREGGESGPALVAGQSERSLVIDRILGRNKMRRMPPASDGEPLNDRQVATLKRWIDQGAAAPADEKPEADPREHWAFKALVRPAVPAVKHAALMCNPIDAFLAAAWEERGLIPQGPADRRTLLRRLTLDLLGVPPTRAQQEAFVADTAPDALEKVVDRLLNSPQYGERWGRHWMDIWRYSDWWGLGQEVRNSQKHMWHWRDWIIESLNSDKGYDQMLREMLAADELFPNDLARLRATGFLARHYFRFNRTTWLDEAVEHTSKAFLGLTLNCCKCHDHKYDPLPQTDYYRLRAFFEPYQVRLEQVPGETDYERDGIPRAFDCNLDAPTYLFVRGDESNPVKNRPLTPGLPAVLTWTSLDIRPVALPAEARHPGLRPFVLENYLRLEEKNLAAGLALGEQARRMPPGPVALALRHLGERKRAAAEAQMAALKARAAADHAAAAETATRKDGARQAALAERRTALALVEEAQTKAELDLLRADPAKKSAAEKACAVARDAVASARAALAAPGDGYTPLRGALKTVASNLETEASRNRPFPRTSTGRRAALARWLTDRKNPLTARVAVNHIWARHFGQPLVETVFDFGRKGSPPSHPALLDYLAVEFMEHGWSMKHLHRLIVTSAAYQLTSSSAGADTKTKQTDPGNRYYWRHHPTRMEAQILRDSLLDLAGELDTRMGGPPIPVAEDGCRRRSIYFFHSHNEQQRFLGVFDDASVLQCYRRTESIVPQQALALANSKLTLSMAARINDRLHQESAQRTDADFIRRAFEAILAAVPSSEELAACQEALAQWRGLGRTHPDVVRRARGNLVHALLNHNDFITIR